MKGLLIKDLMLMKAQKRTYFILIIMAGLLAYSMRDVSIVSGYLTVTIPLLALSTISYDEFDNGNAFLFSLPFSRKEYVAEKYILTMLMGLLSLAIAALFTFIIDAFGNFGLFPVLIESAGLYICIMALTISLMIPLNLKYGAEKAKIVMFIMIPIIIGLSYGVVRIFSRLGIEFGPAPSLDELPMGYILPCAAALFISISLFISFRIIKKKEF